MSQTNIKQQRILWVDIARGLSMILVVAGHYDYGIFDKYLSWFRMPFFFVISGLVFKYIEPQRYWNWAKIQFERLMLPYFSFGILLSFILFIYTFDWRIFISNILKLIYGGAILKGIFGVFWFITCLLLTRLVFGYILKFSRKTQILIISFSYIISHIISRTSLGDINFPWNIDVTLFSITYFSIGYYGKNYIKNMVNDNKYLLFSAIVSIIFIALDYTGYISYVLSLKSGGYYNFVLDLIIPLSNIILLCSLCKCISKFSFSKILSYIGAKTSSIMYLHIPLNTFLMNFFDYGLVMFELIGIIIPIVLSAIIFERFFITRFLFLGKIPIKKERKTTPIIVS